MNLDCCHRDGFQPPDPRDLSTFRGMKSSGLFESVCGVWSPNWRNGGHVAAFLPGMLAQPSSKSSEEPLLCPSQIPGKQKQRKKNPGSTESNDSNNWNVLTIERQIEVCQIRLKRRLPCEESSDINSQTKPNIPAPRTPRGIRIPAISSPQCQKPTADAQHSSGVPAPRTRPAMRRLAPVRNHRLLDV